MLSLSARNNRYLGVLFPLLAFGAIGVLVPSPAEAHFKIDAPPSWMSQDSVGGPQKTGPCAAVPNTGLGDPAGTPTNMVSVVQSGQPISVSVTATIAHPGWFRIALAEGASATQTLATIADPQAQTGTNCTPAILANPVWSTTQPIIADGLPAGSTAGTVQSGNQTFSVTIPQSASCTSAQPCTLQVIMVMTDHPVGDCYYHHCADISIGTATDAGTGTATDAGSEVPGKSAPGCGCVLSSPGGASWAMVAAGLVALAAVRRRRR